uniref:Uncharacterized protein n=1 Tax=Arundo donax TaxID=35708 RepID=A0A0A9DCG5_ARUDO
MGEAFFKASYTSCHDTPGHIDPVHDHQILAIIEPP